MSAARKRTSSQAGPLGERVRSDLHVVFHPASRGGICLEIDSKVGLYYGEAIEAQARSVLERFGVRHARLVLSDRGALPFTIEARIVTALRRAGLSAKPAPSRRPKRRGGLRERLRRSRLYLPGNTPKMMVNAGLHGADAIILDLEDSAPLAEKDAARALVASALRVLDFGAAERMVRINQLPLGLEDIDAVLPAAPELLLLPKVEDAREVAAVDERIAAAGLPYPVGLMPIIESALGVEKAFEIAKASERIVALTIGLEDYTADLGVVKTKEGGETLYARRRLVNAARAAGVAAIDSVYGDVGDIEGLEAWARASRALGFEGMGCIHPRQIPVIHKAFAPSSAEIERALRIVEAFEQAREDGLGVVSLGTKMIDPPVVNRALKLVEQARAMGLLDDTKGGGR